MNPEAYLEGYLHKSPEVDTVTPEVKPPAKKSPKKPREADLNKLVNKTLKKKLA